MNKHLLHLGFLILGMFNGLWAQRTVTGTVTDEVREPLQGVTVLMQGSKNGAITNSQGQYALIIPHDDVVLEFSFMDYATQAIKVGNRSILDVKMDFAEAESDKVVFSALGLARPRDELAATYSSVLPEKILPSGEPILPNALAAKASGLRVARSSGDPGASVSLWIRGAQTITGAQEALVILDGIPISTSTLYGGGNGNRTAGVAQQSRLGDLNPYEIASIDILKGAAATSVWGSRGANGVIVITTQRGTAGKTSIRYNSTYSIDRINAKHSLQTAFGQGAAGVFDEGSAYSWGDRIKDRSGSPDTYVSGSEQFTHEDGTIYRPIAQKNQQAVFTGSNFDQVFQNGHSWQNNLSISGGGKQSRVYFGLGHLDQQGIIRNSDYRRTNLRLNHDMKLNKWMTLSSRSAYIYADANRIQQGDNAAGLYQGLLLTPPDFDNTHYTGEFLDNNGETFAGRHRSLRRPLGGTEPDPVWGNPGWTLHRQKATSTVSRFLISSELNIDPIPWLGFTLRGGVDGYQDRRLYFFPVNSPGPERSKGLFGEDLISEREFNFDAMARGRLPLGAMGGFAAVLGWNFNDRNRQLNFTSIRDFQADIDLTTTELNTGDENSSLSNLKRLIQSNRLYGRMSFNLLSRVYLNLSGSQEAASTIRNPHFFPAVDAAWHIIRPGDKLLVSFAQLRASWGQSGTQPQAHRFQTLAESGFIYGNGLSLSQLGGGFRVDDDLGNPDLRPEIKSEWEIGADLRLLKDRMNLRATYYNNRIKDLLLQVPAPPSSGFLSEYLNAGAMQNRGFEVDLEYALIRQKFLSLHIFGNFSVNENQVTDLPDVKTVNLTPGAVISSRAVEGHALGVLWGLPLLRNNDGSLDLDENGFPQAADEPTVIGDPNPAWQSSLGAQVKFLGIHLRFRFDHSEGGQYAQVSRSLMQHYGTHASVGREENLTESISNYGGSTFAAGTTVRGNVVDFGEGPVLLDEAWYRAPGGGAGSGVIDELAVSDASWTRLREISLGYTVRGNWLEKLRLGSLSITATGRNLLLWTGIDGIDPEVNQYGVGNGFGVDHFTHPGTKSYLLSLALTY